VTPSIRVVIPTYNAKALTLACLESVVAADWPKERLELVVVDNASTDGSAEAVARQFPNVRVIRSDHNLGFAGGANLGLLDLGETDFVGLLNNDVQVEREWLRALVEVLEDDDSIGAVTSKVLFAGRYVSVELELPDLEQAGGFDARSKGVRIDGVRVDGKECWQRAQFIRGFYDPELDPGRGTPYRWVGPHAELRIPVGSAEILVSAQRPQVLAARSGDVEENFAVDGRERWIELPSDGPEVDVINNVGSLLVPGGFGADRGFQEVDRGQYEEVAEVFAWSGTSVLFRRAYLEDVGLLDAHLFMYYEDLDLSWRGRALGWRIAYVPGSVVRHLHAATSVEGSSLFRHYVERNRLVVHAKNAPPRYAARVAGNSLRETALHVRRDVVRPLIERRRPTTVVVRQRLHAFGGFLTQVPRALAARRRLGRRRRVPEEELLRWLGLPDPNKSVGSVERDDKRK
jgi:GT2 family glycosyltransferase